MADSTFLLVHKISNFSSIQVGWVDNQVRFILSINSAPPEPPLTYSGAVFSLAVPSVCTYQIPPDYFVAGRFEDALFKGIELKLRPIVSKSIKKDGFTCS